MDEDSLIERVAHQDVAIEQLRRELAATVDALQLERKQRASDCAVVDRTTNSARVLQLLTCSQEEASTARREIVTVRLDAERLADQATVLRRQINRLRDDSMALKLSIQNSTAHMRAHGDSLVARVAYEGRAAARERELAEALAAMEARARQLQGDLVVATADLQATRAYTESMEMRMTDLSTSKAAIAQSKLQGKFDTMEKVADELSRRAERAEKKLAALMAASGIALKPGGANLTGGGAEAAAVGAAVQQAVAEGVLLTRESIDKVENFLRTLPDVDDNAPKAAASGKQPTPKKGGTGTQKGASKSPALLPAKAKGSTRAAGEKTAAASKPVAPPTKPTAPAHSTAAKTKPQKKSQGVSGRAISNGSFPAKQ